MILGSPCHSVGCCAGQALEYCIMFSNHQNVLEKFLYDKIIQDMIVPFTFNHILEIYNKTAGKNQNSFRYSFWTVLCFVGIKSLVTKLSLNHHVWL